MTERSVTVLVTYQGEQLGEIGPFPVAAPRWQEVGEVARESELRLGVPVHVLRLLTHDSPDTGIGGSVAYHAEALRLPGAELTGSALTVGEDPLRAPWATPAGLRSALEWAAAAARAVGPAEQVKSWNLSGLYRLPTADGPVWLKTTPAFAVPEAEVIGLLASVDPELVPPVLAAAEGRLLLGHLPGVDCWGLPDDGMLDAVPRLVAAQAALAGRAAVLPDRTPRTLPERFAALLPRLVLTAAERADADRLLADLPVLIEELAACGLPETLVHGDFHPGNWRFDGARNVLIDFSDSYYGHPAVDGLRPQDFLDRERWETVRRLWIDAWTAHAPGSDPARALELAEPLVHLGYAVRYQEFLDGIEATERVYHHGDPESETRAALACR
ncbi:aminoglycoside phosphotransferase family protein [Kitasatospora sp. NPDC002040]|uniref:aminoglycoside phosphotransferase family protein n=1 Tax=Kitasatospora sp. NPDC002040 TaxID=3154661 RepID=UPI0033294C19